MRRTLGALGVGMGLGCAGLPLGPSLSLPEADLLGLDAASYGRLLDYAALEAEDADVCQLLPEATALASALGGPLTAQRDAVSGDEARVAAFDEAVEAIDRDLDGLFLAVEGPILHVTADLGELAHRNLDGAAALRAAGDFLGTRHPAWIRPTSDLDGCADPGAAAEALSALVGAWKDAPGCIKEVLRPQLQAAVLELGEVVCFCSNQRQVREGIDALEPSLKHLKRLQGPVALAALRAGLSEGQFNDSCSE